MSCFPGDDRLIAQKRKTNKKKIQNPKQKQKHNQTNKLTEEEKERVADVVDLYIPQVGMAVNPSRCQSMFKDVPLCAGGTIGSRSHVS
jgi:trimethylamine:corrinoid methyltransferase-like protein